MSIYFIYIYIIQYIFGAWVRTSYFSVKCRMPDLSARVESNAVPSVLWLPLPLRFHIGSALKIHARCRLGLAKCPAPRNTKKKLLYHQKMQIWNPCLWRHTTVLMKRWVQVQDSETWTHVTRYFESDSKLQEAKSVDFSDV